MPEYDVLELQHWGFKDDTIEGGEELDGAAELLAEKGAKRMEDLIWLRSLTRKELTHSHYAWGEAQQPPEMPEMLD